MKKYLLFILTAFFILACEKRIDWQLPDGNNNYIVVDGTITDEQKIQTIKITRPVTRLNDKPEPITGAVVKVSVEDSVFVFTETPVNSGIYKSNNVFLAVLGKTYTLYIYYDKKEYTALASMVSTSRFKTLKYAKNKNDELYHIEYIAGPYNSSKSSMWEVLLDWSYVHGYETINPDSCKATLYSYTLPTLDVSEIFSPDIQRISFPAGTIITERRYSLTPEHTEFFRALLCETNWRGGLFDSSPANVPTNLSKGAIGFFGVCEVIEISITVEP
ncbi:MAG: DUF4249 family protein [Bacteroidia bacterium]|nr:DUF4249 family protein [Bacteroidia bacterium]